MCFFILCPVEAPDKLFWKVTLCVYFFHSKSHGSARLIVLKGHFMCFFCSKSCGSARQIVLEGHFMCFFHSKSCGSARQIVLEGHFMCFFFVLTLVDIYDCHFSYTWWSHIELTGQSLYWFENLFCHRKFEPSLYKYYQTEWETCIHINVGAFRYKSKVRHVNMLYVFVFWGLWGTRWEVATSHVCNKKIVMLKIVKWPM